MKRAQVPDNELARIRSLYALAILDTPPEPYFDDLVQLATQISGCEIALISLVDSQRQWFKARCGLAATQTDRDLAFCAHAILASDIMEVEDATRDERFADNPLVTGAPHIRFYAGVPLVSRDGFAYGTLCVIDGQPRKLSPEQRAALQRLARQALYCMESRQANAQLETVASQLTSLMEFLPDGLITTDLQGNITHVNSIARTWHGVDPRAVPRERWPEYFELLDGDGQTRLSLYMNPLARALRGEKTTEQELLVRAKGQPDRLVVCSADFLQGPSGSAVGAIVVMHDISGLRKRDREIANARNYLQQLIDAATDVSIIATDLDGVITLFNAGAERMLGYMAADMVGKQTPEVLHLQRQVLQRSRELGEQHGYAVRGFEVFVHDARKNGTDTRQWTYVRRDGSHMQVRLSISPMRDDRNQIVGYLGIAMDLTAQLLAEASASLNAERFHRAFSAAAQGMALVSTAGRWIDVNQALCDMFGYTREEFLARDFQQISHADDLATDLELVRQTLEGTINHYQIEKRYFTKAGDILHAVLSVALVRDSVGRPVHFVSQIQDVSAFKRMEKLKDDFVSTVSHELRTPLTSISGALRLLREGVLGPVPESMQNMLDVAEQNSQRLTALINDLLDVEKLGAGKMQFTFGSYGLIPLLEEARLSMQSYADPLGVSLVREGDVEVAVDVDAMRFAQVLTNLLSNACKYSPRGGVVTIAHRRFGDEVEISVTDQGPGIPPKFREQMFQKFSQADGGAARDKGGTGLGLVICRDLVQHMRGTIGFESPEGMGTRFWIRLPVQTPGAIASTTVRAQ